jgi:hypothetical protein
MSEIEIEIEIDSADVDRNETAPASAYIEIRNSLTPKDQTITEAMTVRVIDRSGWGTSAPFPAIRRVETSVRCSVCGGRRGEPRNHNFHEDGQWLACDVWDNPCGHTDMYQDVIAEARELRNR